MRILLVAVAITIRMMLVAQQPYFSNAYTSIPGAEFAGAVVQNSDSGFVTVFFYDNPTRGYGFLRTDKNGDTIITKHYTGLISNRVILGYNSDALIRTSSGNFVAVGATVDLAAQTPADAFVVKFNSIGDTVASWSYPGSGDDELYGVCEDDQHNILACGRTDSYGFGGNDIWLVKLDSSLNYIYDTVFGGSVNDYSAVICNTRGNGFIIGGRLGNYSCLLKLDSTLGIEWMQSYFGYANGAMVAEMPDSGYVFSCGGGIAALGQWPMLVRTDNSGVIMWTRNYGAANYSNGFWSAPVVSNNRIVAAGTISDSSQYQVGYIVQTDLSGNVIWQRTYWLDTLGPEWFSDIEVCIDGGYIAAGITPVDYTGPWLLRIDSLGCEAPGCDPLGFSNYSISEVFRCYPNPASDVLQIETFSDKLKSVLVTDQLGQLIYSVETSEQRHTISVESFAEGIYFYSIIEDGELKANGKFVVMH